MGNPVISFKRNKSAIPYIFVGMALSAIAVLILLLPPSSKKDAIQNHLFTQAETHGYGYKTANLLELQTALKTVVPINAISVAVPEFMGITHKDIIDLFHFHGINLPKEWNILRKKHCGSPAEQKKIILSKALPQPFINHLKKLRGQIYSLTKKSPIVLPASLKNFIAIATRNQWKLMVRSTGKEDTDALSNAGGNHTQANVLPDEAIITQALCSVVASYFSKKSLMQRLQAGDTTLFNFPLTPVLIQRMIGETPSTKPEAIPIGCVAYSQEPSAQTPGITAIQASYGHNEGVVESSVPSDTFYVTSEKCIFQIIKNKTKRLVPHLNQATLTFVPNPEMLQEKPTLDHLAVLAIDHVVRTVENHYQKPMDLELVYDPALKIMYVVQARPIVCPTKSTQPSYLDASPFDKLRMSETNIRGSGGKIAHPEEPSSLSLSLSKGRRAELGVSKEASSLTQTNSIPCITICTGNNNVQKITSKQTILLAQTLNQALDRYNAMGSEKKSIQAVIIERNGQTTSHAAAIFRGEGILVIQTKSLQPLASWLNNPNMHIYLDPQRQTIVHADKQTNLAIKTGFLNHPIAAHFSLDESLTNNPQPTTDIPIASSYQELVGRLKDRNHSTVLQATQDLNNKLIAQLVRIQELNRIYTQEENKYLAARATNTARILQNIIANVSAIVPHLTAAAGKHSTMQQLLHARFIEALLLQKPSQDTVNDYSVTTVLNDYNNSIIFCQTILQPLIKKGKISLAILHNHLLLNLGYQGSRVALTEKITDKWLRFINALNTHASPHDHLELNAMVQKITQANLFTSWLNGSFLHAYEMGSSLPARQRSRKCLKILLEEYASAQELITTFSRQQTYLANVSTQLWEQPATVQRQLNDFHTNVLAFFHSKEFTSLLSKSRAQNTFLHKTCLAAMLLDAIEHFDLLIKTIKGSTQFPTEKEKIIIVRQALHHYFELLKQFNPAPRLTVAIKHILDAAPNTAEQLTTSKNFNVGDIVLFETQYKQHPTVTQSKVNNLIKTLEDAFTSTHQLLLRKISTYVAKKWKLQDILAKPLLVAQAEKKLKLSKLLTGIGVEKDALTYVYHRKLRAHSVGITLRYVMATRSLTITTQFYGENEFARWTIITDYLSTIAKLTKLNLTHLENFDTGLTYSWNITGKKHLNVINTSLYNSIATTFALGIEHEDAIIAKTTTILHKLTNHSIQLAGGKESLINQLIITGSPKNLLLLALIDSFDQNNKEQKTLLAQILQTAKENIATKNDAMIPLSLCTYKQAAPLFNKPGRLNDQQLKTIWENY